jgi:hypothetical protein
LAAKLAPVARHSASATTLQPVANFRIVEIPPFFPMFFIEVPSNSDGQRKMWGRVPPPLRDAASH